MVLKIIVLQHCYNKITCSKMSVIFANQPICNKDMSFDGIILAFESTNATISKHHGVHILEARAIHTYWRSFVFVLVNVR